MKTERDIGNYQIRSSNFPRPENRSFRILILKINWLKRKWFVCDDWSSSRFIERMARSNFWKICKIACGENPFYPKYRSPKTYLSYCSSIPLLMMNNLSRNLKFDQSSTALEMWLKKVRDEKNWLSKTWEIANATTSTRMLVADDSNDDDDSNDVDDGNDVDDSNDADDVVENFFPGICISLQSQRLGKNVTGFTWSGRRCKFIQGPKKPKRRKVERSWGWWVHKSMSWTLSYREKVVSLETQ